MWHLYILYRQVLLFLTRSLSFNNSSEVTEVSSIVTVSVSVILALLYSLYINEQSIWGGKITVIDHNIPVVFQQWRDSFCFHCTNICFLHSSDFSHLCKSLIQFFPNTLAHFPEWILPSWSSYFEKTVCSTKYIHPNGQDVISSTNSRLRTKFLFIKVVNPLPMWHPLEAKLIHLSHSARGLLWYSSCLK